MVGCPDRAPIKVQIPGDIPTVEGDAAALLQVFSNLLGNASRHTPADGEIIVTAEERGGEVVVTVTDTGEGIPPEHLPHIFERFYRVDSARSRGQGGTGLGLAICQSIVQAHRGSITIESVVGQGTVVHLTLPQARSLDAGGSILTASSIALDSESLTPSAALASADPAKR
jgi:signal transduction histidine kinase